MHQTHPHWLAEKTLCLKGSSTASIVAIKPSISASYSMGSGRVIIHRVSNRKYESMQNQATAVFPSRSTIGKIETVPQMGMTLKMFAPNAILNQQY